MGLENISYTSDLLRDKAGGCIQTKKTDLCGWVTFSLGSVGLATLLDETIRPIGYILSGGAASIFLICAWGSLCDYLKR